MWTKDRLDLQVVCIAHFQIPSIFHRMDHMITIFHTDVPILDDFTIWLFNIAMENHHF